jgi:ABC-type histidine transport system ATPase subunit
LSFYGTGEGIAIVVATNEPYIARHAADWICLLEKGRWVEMGLPDILFANPRKERTRQFLNRILPHDI